MLRSARDPQGVAQRLPEGQAPLQGARGARGGARVACLQERAERRGPGLVAALEREVQDLSDPGGAAAACSFRRHCILGRCANVGLRKLR